MSIRFAGHDERMFPVMFDDEVKKLMFGCDRENANCVCKF